MTLNSLVPRVTVIAEPKGHPAIPLIAHLAMTPAASERHVNRTNPPQIIVVAEAELENTVPNPIFRESSKEIRLTDWSLHST